MAWKSDGSRTGSAIHRKWKAAVLHNDRGMCRIKDEGCTTLGTEADHIVPVAEGGNYSLANGQAACKSCHHKKTMREAARGRARHRNKLKRPEEKHPGFL